MVLMTLKALAKPPNEKPNHPRLGFHITRFVAAFTTFAFQPRGEYCSSIALVSTVRSVVGR
jgi:hypothetical protein